MIIRYITEPKSEPPILIQLNLSSVNSSVGSSIECLTIHSFGLACTDLVQIRIASRSDCWWVLFVCKWHSLWQTVVICNWIFPIDRHIVCITHHCEITGTCMHIASNADVVCSLLWELCSITEAINWLNVPLSNEKMALCSTLVWVHWQRTCPMQETEPDLTG